MVGFLQSISWVTCLGFLACFFATVVLLSKALFAWTAGVVFVISLSCTVFCAAIVTVSDNSKWNWDESADLVMCSVCQAMVHPLSKHCRICNRCTFGFDHHCMWVNNCIGRKNYSAFIALLVGCCVSTAVIVAFSLRLLFADEMRLRAEELYGMTDVKGLQGAVVVMVVVAGIVMLKCSVLLSFHIFLAYRGVSTYDFVVLKRRSRLSSVKSWQTAPLPEAASESSPMSHPIGPIIEQQSTVLELGITAKELIKIPM